MAVDLKALSAYLGLSPTTVSRALNGYTEVKLATRERVLQAAQELGYQPNRAARQIALGRSDAIGILHTTRSGGLADARFFEVMEGLSDHLERRNVDLFIVPAHPENELAVYERLIKSRRVDAFVVSRTQVDDARIQLLRSFDVPFVAYGRTGGRDDATDMAWLDFDNEAGMAEATRRLLDLGHREIAYIGAPSHLNFAVQRWAGFEKVMAEAGVPVRPDWRLEADLGRQDGYRAAQAFMKLPLRPSALLVDNYLSGLGAIRGLMDAGVRIGRDLSVIVYDFSREDSLLQDLVITSVDQPTFYDTGWKLGEMAMGLVEHGHLEQAHVLLKPVLVEGNSTAPRRLSSPD